MHQSQIQTEKRQEKKDPSHTDFKGDLQIVDYNKERKQWLFSLSRLKFAPGF